MRRPFEVDKIRADFPILRRKMGDISLAYLDNAATTQKPKSVIDAVQNYYQHSNANVHRGVHVLSIEATELYESARKKVANFIHAANVDECIFVRGTTEAINLVAQSYVLPKIKVGDEILITYLEHHSNIVPWQQVCELTGAKLVVAPINQAGEVEIERFAELINERTAFVSISHMSNALGTVNDVKKMIDLAHQYDVKVMVDGAQAVAHQKVDVQALGADFYAFSGHKIYGPTGIGVLWGRQSLLDAMRPYQGGGDMIKYVTFAKTEYAAIPTKFEAGTPNIAGSIGLGAAIDYLSQWEMQTIADYESKLLAYAKTKLAELADIEFIGNAQNQASVLSFIHQKAHAHDIGTILDNFAVAVRSGHHCAMPVMDFYNVAATTRASFAFYNTFEEIDRLQAGLIKVSELF